MSNDSNAGELQGWVHPDFAGVAVTLARQLRRVHGGAAVAIYHREKPVVDLWSGVRDEAGRPWEEKTLSLSFSVTKGVTATALHLLVDRGQLEYDDPVARYWPEFAQGGKAEITVRQLLSHQAGLYPIRSYIDSAERVIDWKYMTDVLAAAKPVHEPGALHGYHAWTFGWLIGELVQRISGKPLGEFIQTELAGPLGLDGLFIGAPASEHARVASTLRPRRQRDIERLRPLAKRIERGLRALRIPVSLEAFARSHIPQGIESFNFDAPETLSATIPAVNGLFTARSLARLYAALGNGGTLDGVRLMSEETLRQATTQQTNRGDYVLFGIRMNWRLGYQRAFSLRGGIRSSFGHIGANGSCSWADPQNRLALGYVLNYGMRRRNPYMHMLQLSSAAQRCAKRR